MAPHHPLTRLLLLCSLLFTVFPALSDAPILADNGDSNNRATSTRHEVIAEGKALGKRITRKSRELYQAARDNGAAAGRTIAEESTSAWVRTRAFGSAAIDWSRNLGKSISDHSRQLYQAVTPPARDNTAQHRTPGKG